MSRKPIQKNGFEIQNLMINSEVRIGAQTQRDPGGEPRLQIFGCPCGSDRTRPRGKLARQ